MALDKWTWHKDLLAELGELPTEEAAEEAAQKLLSQDIGTEEVTVDAETVRTLSKNDLNFLAGLAIPEVFKVFYPPVLLAVWELLCASITSPDAKRRDPKLALGIPRNHAKTTLIKLFALWCILFTKKHFILVTCSTADRAENIVSDIKDMLNEPNIIRVFGDWKIGLEIDRQNLKQFSFLGRNIIIAAIGAEGSLRGMNIKNRRPDLMLFDDIQTRDCADSKQQSEILERWLIGTAMKAKSPEGCMFIYAGNMYPTPNCVLAKLKTNPTWTKFISGAILSDGTALWEELRGIDTLIDEFDGDLAMGHPEIFFSEMMNDVNAGTNNRIDLSLIREWKWHPSEKPQGKFIVIDPASNKMGGDDVAIGYFEVYDGYPGLRNVIEEKLSPGDTIRRALILALQTGTRLIAVESTAYQFSLLYWFDFICQQLEIDGFHFVELYTGNYSKNARITDMLKTLIGGEIFVHPEIKSLVTTQIVHWNPLKRNNKDGVLDLLTYAPRTIELYMGLISTMEDLGFQEATQVKVLTDNHAF